MTDSISQHGAGIKSGEDVDSGASYRILVIDPFDLLGDVLVFVLKYRYNDTVRVVRSMAAGWASLEAEPADAIFLYLHGDRVEAKGCSAPLGLSSMALTIAADQGPLRKASQFCQQLRSIPKFQQVAIIVFGAKSPGEIYDELRQVGASGYLRLPYLVDEMFAARDAAVRGERYFP